MIRKNSVFNQKILLKGLFQYRERVMDMIDEFINAAKEGLTEDIEKMLKEHPELLHAVKDNGESPLLAALYHGKQTVVQQLLAYGAAISLHEACALGDVDTVKYLVLEESAPISEYSFDGWTPLHLASFFGGYEAALFLIEQGADVNAISSNNLKNRPIHAATAGRKFPLVELLLMHQADPNLKQDGGWTPLIQAVHNFDKDMVKLLLSHGADSSISNDKGHTAIDVAAEKEYEDILELLERK
jgi:ankyrin repeat protein